MDNEQSNTGYNGYGSGTPSHSFDSFSSSTISPDSYSSSTIGPNSYSSNTTGSNSYSGSTMNPNSYNPKTMGPSSYSSSITGANSYNPSTMGPNSYSPGIMGPSSYSSGSRSQGFDTLAQSKTGSGFGHSNTRSNSYGDSHAGYYHSGPYDALGYQGHADYPDEEAGQVQLTGYAAQDTNLAHYPEGLQELGLPSDAAIQSFDTEDNIPFIAGITDVQSVGPKSNNLNVAGEDKYTMVERNGRVVKLYKQPRWNMATVRKHTPLAPKGTKFQWSDNSHIIRKPIRKGNAERGMLRFEVIDTEGSFHERFFHKIDENKWDDVKWISDANKWRSQTIRRLFRADPTFQTNKIREKWTEEETSHFKSSILGMVKKNNRALAGKDWDEIADEHNQKFFSGGTNMLGVPSNNIPGLRTASSLRTKYKRFPDLVAQVETEIEKQVGGEAEIKIKEEADEEAEKKSEKHFENEAEKTIETVVEKKMENETQKEAKKEAENMIKIVAEKKMGNETQEEVEKNDDKEAEAQEDAASVQEATGNTEIKSEFKDK